MDKWAGFYEKLFNFREIRYFDIEGKKTGLFSRAHDQPVRQDPHPDQRVAGRQVADRGIPARVPRRRHPAHRARHRRHLRARSTCCARRACSSRTRPTPTTKASTRACRGHGENLDELRKRRILIDGDPEKGEGLLLQIFTQNVIGPIFFEIIQRKGNEGFGEGNFKALFESIELRPDAREA